MPAAELMQWRGLAASTLGVRVRSRGVSLTVDDDNRDVVAGAALQRQAKQVVDRSFRIGGFKQGGDFVVRDMHGQAVAAQKEPVAEIGGSVHDFEFRL